MKASVKQQSDKLNYQFDIEKHNSNHVHIRSSLLRLSCGWRRRDGVIMEGGNYSWASTQQKLVFCTFYENEYHLIKMCQYLYLFCTYAHRAAKWRLFIQVYKKKKKRFCKLELPQLSDWSIDRTLVANYINNWFIILVIFPSKKVKHLLVTAS